jgi:nucleotide-binding universal stress UspA family protein
VGGPAPADLRGLPAGGATPTLSPDLQDELAGAVDALPDELRALPVFERGNPANVLLGHAETGVDLLLIGSSGHRRLTSALLGSTAKAVVRAAPCPVVVLPTG